MEKIIGEAAKKKNKGPAHIGPTVHKCHKCDFTSGTPSRMRMHYTSVHSGRKDFVCEMCGMAFALKGGLEEHTGAVHLKKKDHLCDQCDYAARAASTLRNHIKAVHEKIKNNLCPVCGKAFSYEQSMKSHCRRVHGIEKSMTLKRPAPSKDCSKHQCDIIPSEQVTTELEKNEDNSTNLSVLKVVSNDLPIAQDLEEKHEPGMFQEFEDAVQGILMDSTANEEVEMVKWKQTVETPLKVHICEMCGYKAITDDTLKIHNAAAHNGPKDFVCKICGYAAATESVVNQHMKKDHPIKRVYLCEKCGYKGKTPKDRQDHMRTAHKRTHPDHKCEKCNYTSKKLDHLKTHKKAVHSGIKDFVSPVAVLLLSRTNYISTPRLFI